MIHADHALMYGRDDYPFLPRSPGIVGKRIILCTVEVEYELTRSRAVLVWVILGAAFVGALVLVGIAWRLWHG